jgi:hypothetical protein
MGIEQFVKVYESKEENGPGSFFKKYPQLNPDLGDDELICLTDQVVKGTIAEQTQPRNQTIHNERDENVINWLQYFEAHHIEDIIPRLPQNKFGVAIFEALMKAPRRIEWLSRRLEVYERAVGGEHLNTDDLKKFIKVELTAKIPTSEEMNQHSIRRLDDRIVIRTRTKRGDYGFRTFVVAEADVASGYEFVVYEENLSPGNLPRVLRGWFTHLKGGTVQCSVLAPDIFDVREIELIKNILQSNPEIIASTEPSRD